MRSLVSNSIYAKKDRNGPSSANQEMSPRCLHPSGAHSMAVSGLACRKALVGTGRAISVLFGINGLRNKPSYIIGPPFLGVYSYARLSFPENLD